MYIINLELYTYNENNNMKKETIYKTLTVILLLALVGGYLTWLKGYTKHLNTCELNHSEKTCV